MQVEVFHRHNLAVAAPGCPPFDPEGRPHTRLANAGDRLFADPAQPLGQANGRGCLAFTQGSRRNSGDIDIFSLGAVGKAL